MTHRILITGAIHSVGREQLAAQPDIEVVYRPDLPHAEILKIIHDFDCILSRSETDIDKAMIDAGVRLKVISRAAVGVGNIDLDYATQKGILVINTPAKNTNSAAELTMGLLLAAMRQMMPAHQTMARGGWERHRFHGTELRGKTIGIVGLGNVGHRVAKFARGFDMRVLAYDPYISDTTFERWKATKCATLAEMLPQCDVLTVHVPKNKETAGMIGAAEIAWLPKGAVVLNAARGGVIREGAVLAGLESGHLRAAGIDTWEVEPPVGNPLIGRDDVVMTPHIGATTEEAQRAIAETVAEQTLKALRGDVVDTPVNMPHVVSELSPEIKRYSVLAERLGAFAGQYIDFNPSQLRFLYRGELTAERAGLVRLAFLKGFLKPTLDDDTYISVVNAARLIEGRGIQIAEEDDPTYRAYRSSIRVTVSSRDASFEIGGTVFDQAHDRFTWLDGFSLEMEPRGHLLVVKNDDRPGMIGRIGSTLGDRRVNIDAFELSRQQRGGTAMALIRMDEAADGQTISQLRAIPGVRLVKGIELQ